METLRLVHRQLGQFHEILFATTVVAKQSESSPLKRENPLLDEGVGLGESLTSSLGVLATDEDELE